MGVAEHLIKKNLEGGTALHHATLRNQVKIAKAVIVAGVDIDAQEKTFNMTALHMAVILDRLEIGQILLEAGANINIKCGSEYTALELADNHFEFAEMMRRKGFY